MGSKGRYYRRKRVIKKLFRLMVMAILTIAASIILDLIQEIEQQQSGHPYVLAEEDQDLVRFFEEAVVKCDEKSYCFVDQDFISSAYYLGDSTLEIPEQWQPYEDYGQLDNMNRVTTAYAILGPETMPPENAQRGDISSIKPTGWVQNKYPNIITDGEVLYNRSHLIAYMLSGENDNEKNLMTGTRYFNATGMLEYESKVANYIQDTKGHVLYKVSPIFKDDDKLAYGVVMNACSIEDMCGAVNFRVFVPNVQPGVAINYKTGENHAR